MDPAVPSERKWDWGLGINLLSFGGLAVPSQTVFGSIGILYIYIHTSYIYICVYIYMYIYMYVYIYVCVCDCKWRDAYSMVVDSWEP